MIPTISTIIPAYNRASLIGETLRAVLSQTRPPVDVIVVDDGSSDGTPDIVTEKFGKDVTLLRQTNAGAGAARNAGFARSRGEVVNFMDSDDIPSLNTYQVQGDAIAAGADMVYGPWIKTRIDGSRLSPEPVALQAGPVPDKAALPRLVLSGDWVTVFQPCLFRRSVIEAAGPYRTDLKTGEDIEMLYRILGEKPHLRHVPQTILLYRVHPEGQVSERDLGTRLVDRANFWNLSQLYAAKRSDFGAVQRRMYRVKKIDVAREARALDADLAAMLERDITAVDRAIHPIFKLSVRARAKIGMLRHRHRYTAPFAAGPLTPEQADQIGLLGYRLPGSA